MTPDQVCERHSEKSVELSVGLIRADDAEGPDLVLIEGRPEALRMLAELLVAVADTDEEDGFHIEPRGAGGFHFSKTSEFGIYLHRLDKPNLTA